MWCKHCQQDVPGVAIAGNGRFECPRCGSSKPQGRGAFANQLKSLAAVSDNGVDLLTIPHGKLPAVLADDWQVDDDMRQVRRLLRTAQATVGGETLNRTGEASGTHHTGMTSAAPMNVMAYLDAANRHAPAPREETRRRSTIGWIATWLGLAAFMCGATLLGVSLLQGRNDFWNVGMPITLAGQFGLLLGLVLQLDRIRQDNTQTADKLSHVDERLIELRKTAVQMGVHGASNPRHQAADQSNPQAMFADLKGQLDLLTLRLAAAK